MELTAVLVIVIIVLLVVNIVISIIVFGRAKQPPDIKPVEREDRPVLEITPEYMAELEAKTKQAFTGVIDNNAHQLNQSVAAAINRLNAEIDNATNTVITSQIADYQTTLTAAKERIVKNLEELSSRAQARQQELDAALEIQMKERRDKVAAKLDQSLSEIVISYIAESFGPGVDFNSQKSYIFKSLEDHKDELKKDILNGS